MSRVHAPVSAKQGAKRFFDAHSKIFGCVGDTVDDIIVAALLKAYNDKHDIITMSIGDPTVGWSEGGVGVVASRIAATGVVVTAASGKDRVLSF